MTGGVNSSPPAPLWKVAARTPAIDDRDREILTLLAEHRVLVVPQLVMAFADRSPRRVTARLQRLASGQLITHQRIFAGRPAAISITGRGLRTIESGAPAPRVDLKAYRHDIGVGWLHLAARHGVFGSLTDLRLERELRAADQRADNDGPPAGIGVGTFARGGQPSRHYPDLLMRTASGHQIAVELELSAKSTGRLRQIMRAYASDHRITAVLYLVPDAAGARRIESAARRTGIASLVHVQRLAAGGIHGAPPPIAAGRLPAPARNGIAR